MPRKSKGYAKWDYKKRLPKLAAYIERIGAEERNFRRFVIKRDGRNHYHHDFVIIKIEGTKIFCSDPEYAPTDDEAAAIAAELKNEDFPRSIPARNLNKLKPKSGQSAMLFKFFDPSGTKILFVQERINPGTPFKSDLPWSFWDDDEWRMMEPDGGPDGHLPLFGLENLEFAPAVFLHEGAKTAKAVQEMLWGPKRVTADRLWTSHNPPPPKPGELPWKDSLLRLGMHVGWPGGAPNPHRVDWRPLKALAPDIPIYIVCDNDMAGENAAPIISKLLQRHLKVIRFGKAFPEKFDLADPWPKEMWEERKGVLTYVGPSFDDCVGPATWATRTVAVPTDKNKDEKKKAKAEEKPKFKIELREEFTSEWISCVKPPVFMERDRLGTRWVADEFNAKVGPYSDIEDVAKLLRKRASAQSDVVIYEPGEKTGRIAFDGVQAVNVYERPEITPNNGDVSLFLEFMEHLIPDAEDRRELSKWCATLIARPDIKMGYSVILASQMQGIGKTTLAEQILAPLVGMSNCSFPSTKEVLGDYTTWRVFKRLAVVGEIYEGQSANAYNQLKTCITDEWVNAHEKFMPTFPVKNFLHVIASSNSLRPLKLDVADRRWLVPGVTEEKKQHTFWAKLRAWLADGGLGAIAHWASEEVKKPNGYVLPGVEAPMSAAKRESTYAGMTDGEKLMSEFGTRLVKVASLAGNEAQAVEELGKLAHLVRPHGRYVVRLDYMRGWLAKEKSKLAAKYGAEGKQYLEAPERIAHLLKQCGLHIFPKRPKELYADGDRFRIAATFEPPAGAKWKDLEGDVIDPDRLFSI